MAAAKKPPEAALEDARLVEAKPGVWEVVLPVMSYRVLLDDGRTLDVVTSDGMSSVARRLIVDQFGGAAIAGVSRGAFVGFTVAQA